jgi:hypothetical protein
MLKLVFLGLAGCGCVVLACGKSEHDENERSSAGSGASTASGSGAGPSAAGQAAGAAAGATNEGGAAEAGATHRAGAGGSSEPEPDSYGRCFDATYDDAPSGAACNPRHIIQVNGFAGPCHGPDVGSGCGRLSVVLSDAEGTLDGFDCQTEEGVRRCEWIDVDDVYGVELESDLLETLCAVTAFDPDSVVYCINGGS